MPSVLQLLATSGGPGRQQGLAALAAPLDEFVHLRPGVSALELAALDELLHELLGPGPGHVGEGDAPRPGTSENIVVLAISVISTWAAS